MKFFSFFLVFFLIEKTLSQLNCTIKNKNECQAENNCLWLNSINLCQIKCIGTRPFILESITVVKDYNIRNDLCPSIKLYDKADVYPPGSYEGIPGFFADASSLPTANERKTKALSYDYNPFTVDVDKLSDDQINSLCLTNKDCRFPPRIDILRETVTGKVWKPIETDLRKDTMNKANAFSGCQTKEFPDCYMTQSISSQYGRNPTIQQATVLYKFEQGKVTVTGTTLYPRNSVLGKAKIAKINLSIAGTKVYYYQDLTCGSIDSVMRDGFLSRNFYYELKIDVGLGGDDKDDIINTHGPLKFTLNPLLPLNSGNYNFNFFLVKAPSATKINFIYPSQMYLRIT